MKLFKQQNNQTNFKNFRCNRQNNNVEAAQVSQKTISPMKTLGKAAVEKTKLLPGKAVR